MVLYPASLGYARRCLVYWFDPKHNERIVQADQDGVEIRLGSGTKRVSKAPSWVSRMTRV